MNRVSDRVCTLEINTDMTRIICSKCGWEVPHGTDPNTVKECPVCKRLVVYGTPRLYLIGPVTGKPNDNRKAFDDAAARLEADGYAVDIPHAYTNIGEGWDFCMRRSITAMLSIDHKGISFYDGVAMLDGWEESKGATLEKQVAEALGILCRPWREFLSPAKGAAALAVDGALQPIFAPAC